MTREEREALKDEELIAALRKEVAIWFNNTSLLLFEELVRRYTIAKMLALTHTIVVSGAKVDE